jgi:hypothetical protein
LTRESPDEFVLNFLMLTLSAKGLVALALVVPVSLLIVAVAWRIGTGKGGRWKV